jgi:hypothetical protein
MAESNSAEFRSGYYRDSKGKLQRDRQADVEVWPVGFPGIKRITFEFRARTSAAQDWLEELAGYKGRGVTVDSYAVSTLRKCLIILECMRRDGLLVDVTRLVTLDIKTVSKRHRKAS